MLLNGSEYDIFIFILFYFLPVYNFTIKRSYNSYNMKVEFPLKKKKKQEKKNSHLNCEYITAYMITSFITHLHVSWTKTA